jgi:hypothetical protein
MHEGDAGEAATRMSTVLLILAPWSDHSVIMSGALLIIFAASLHDDLQTPRAMLAKRV